MYKGVFMVEVPQPREDCLLSPRGLGTGPQEALGSAPGGPPQHSFPAGEISPQQRGRCCCCCWSQHLVQHTVLQALHGMSAGSSCVDGTRGLQLAHG